MPLFMLASNYDRAKLKLPVVGQPKYDGVRAGNLDGGLTGRSLKSHGNEYTTEYFSHERFFGLDGEMCVREPSDPDLCRMTTSALNSYGGTPAITWHVFDYVLPETIGLPYTERYLHAIKAIDQLRRMGEPVQIMPGYLCHTLEEVDTLHAKFLSYGYEGTILRDPMGKYKEGRSTVREGGLLRIKDFNHSEAVVLSIEEGQTNLNEATVDARGYTERSTHAANMVPNGMVGALICRDIETGVVIRVSAGKMPHAMRLHLWQNQHLIIGKIITYQHFMKGVKDLPRFPTFHNIRAASDIDPALMAMVK